MAVLLFDLDGTLIDSATGITRCVAYALEKLGEPVPPPQALRRWIGPPLRDSFGPLLKDAARTEQAVELYRERFDLHGWAEHEVYPGIGEAIESLHADGHRLAVVTAKNEPHARRIIDHLPFGRRFETVSGATADGPLGASAHGSVWISGLEQRHSSVLGRLAAVPVVFPQQPEAYMNARSYSRGVVVQTRRDNFVRSKCE